MVRFIINRKKNYLYKKSILKIQDAFYFHFILSSQTIYKNQIFCIIVFTIIIILHMLCMQSERTFITMERENFSSRLGFILISAGCAIGLGNVWRFPFITGMYGGASFVLIYLFFLLILGLPIMVAEFSVGRASCRSCCTFI